MNLKKYRTFVELPLQEFDSLKYSVYVINFDWHYLFVNTFVQNNLQQRGKSLIGKNMWQQFPELSRDHHFVQMKKDSDEGKDSDFVTISPVNRQRLHVKGRTLKDCFIFTSAILPIREQLMDELKQQLKSRR